MKILRYLWRITTTPAYWESTGYMIIGVGLGRATDGLNEATSLAMMLVGLGVIVLAEVGATKP